MGDGAPESVEHALRMVLSELGDHDMDPGERATVERDCQRIHAAFGGNGPEEIYPEYRSDPDA